MRHRLILFVVRGERGVLEIIIERLIFFKKNPGGERRAMKYCVLS
jgi:hypothetical protein